MSRRKSGGGKGTAVAVAIGVCLAGPSLAHHGRGFGLASLLSSGSAPAGHRAEARAAVRFERAQLGKPYQWAATGPGSFDCSGLTEAAYASAGVTIPRTSQMQYADGAKVPAGQERPGDLVFFAGADGTASAPGHVGMVVNPARHLMIEAYSTGFAIRVSRYGTPGSAPGDRVVVGFTRPSAGGGG